MARNLENSTSENSNVQETGLRRSVRLNATISGSAPLRLVATRGKVHGVFSTARAVPSKFARARAQASHSHASHTKQPASVEQPTLTAQPTLVAFQAAQVDPRLSQPSGPPIETGAFSPHFFTDLTFPNSNLVPRVYHPSTAQGGAFLPSSSNPNGEQHLSRQVIKLTSALAQQTTLVNQLLQRIGIQRAPDEVSRSRTRVVIGAYLCDLVQRVNVAKKCILEHFWAWNGWHMLGAKGMDEI
ncbi:hypothetical protein ACFX2K_034939 [Malus domestica]